MYIQLIWKRLVTNEVPLSVRRLTLASSMLPPPAFYATPHKNFAKFCTDIAVPSANPDWGFAREFLINRCGLTDAEITNAFRHCNEDLPGNLSTQNVEEVFELLNGCGLTTPAQIRKVVVRNPSFLFYKPESFKIKLSFFRTFMETEDIAKLIYIGATVFNSSESRYKSAVLVLQKLGIEGEALSYFLVTQPRLLTTPEEQVMESFKKAEDLGFKKGSRIFAIAVGAIIAVGQETIDRRRQCLSNLGFSENQISEIWRTKPSTIGLKEEKLKRNVEFLVKIAGLSCSDIVRFPILLAHSVEARMIPRCRVMEALKSMQVQVPKEKQLSSLYIFLLSEKRFLERYINSNAEFSSRLLDIYHEGRESLKADH